MGENVPFTGAIIDFIMSIILFEKVCKSPLRLEASCLTLCALLA